MRPYIPAAERVLREAEVGVAEVGVRGMRSGHLYIPAAAERVLREAEVGVAYTSDDHRYNHIRLLLAVAYFFNFFYINIIFL
jgi:hypothetical protein